MNVLKFRNGDVAVGDVFASSWGYEQTNVGFYQVISTHGKSTVSARPIDSKDVYINEKSFLVPVIDSFVGEEVLKRRVKDCGSKPCIVIDPCEYAYKTEPEKRHRFTTYG